MKFSILFLSLMLLTMCSVYGQEDVAAKHASYYRCIDNIEIAPYEAYAQCSDYLKKYPNDDPRLVDFAGMFVKAFDTITNYSKSVPLEKFSDLTPEWGIYIPDLQKRLPEVNEPEDKHKIVIHRSFGSPKEGELLRKAEALYINPNKTAEELFKNWRYASSAGGTPPAGEPKWGMRGNDEIFQTSLVTTSAVLYYYNNSLTMRKSNDTIPGNGFTFTWSNLKYESSIKKYEKFARGGKTFENVFVADMTLIWGHMCGSLCGAGFTRNKIVG